MSIAVVLLSGGLDSCVGLWLAKEKYAEIHCLTFSYGSKEEKSSLEATKNLTKMADVKNHKIIELPWLNEFSKMRNSKLVSGSVPHLKFEDLKNSELTKETADLVWIPARNLCFLSIAASYADGLKKDVDIIYCANAEEGATFPDNTPEFISRYNEVLKYGTLNQKIKIEAPLFDKTKKEIAKLASKLGVPYEYSCSCYEPQGFEDMKPIHCGKCESDVRRMNAFKKANLEDKTIYNN